MSFPLFIARRIYNAPGEKRRVSRPAITIATIGIAIGLAVMIASVCIVIGFKHSIRDKVIGFGSHIQVSNFMSQMDGDQLPIAVDDSMMNAVTHIRGVKHAERFAYKQGVLKTDHDFLGVVFEGFGQEFDSTFFHNHLIAGSLPHFSDRQATNELIISQTMANKLRLRVNDRVYAYFIDNKGVRMRRFKIVGVYQTNLSQYDNMICLTDIYTTIKLNGWKEDQATGIAITVKDFNNIDEVYQRFAQNVNKHTDHYGQTYVAHTIRELNPQIFSWLDLLNINVYIILLLMMAVASVTMISGLLIIILERTSMIGTLKSLGAKNKTIRHIFIWFSIFIIGKGLVIGNIVGIGLCLLQKYFGIIKLDPSTYYVNTVPIELNIPLIVLLNISTLLISVFVLIAPSYLVSHIHPAKTMKYE